MKINKYKASSFAILAAALYAISSPVSKLLLKEIPPTLMASFLYLGAGLGMCVAQRFLRSEGSLDYNMWPIGIARAHEVAIGVALGYSGARFVLRNSVDAVISVFGRSANSSPHYNH